MFDNKHHALFYIVIGAIILLSILQPLWMFKNSVYVHEDTPFIGVTSPFNKFFADVQNSMFIYENNIYTGVISQSISSVYNLIYDMLLLIPSISNGILASELSNFIFSAIGGLGCFILLYELLSDYENKIRTLLSFVGFLVLYSITGANMTDIAFLPWAFLFMIKFIESKDYNIKSIPSLAIFILLLSTFFAFGGFLYLIQNFIFIGTVLLVLFILYNKKSKRIRLFFLMFLALTLALLINTSMIAGAYLLSKNPISNDYYSFINSAQQYSFGYPNIITTIMFNVNNNQYMIVSILVFIIAISSIFTIKRPNGKVKTNIVLVLLISFLVITFFYNTIAMPFGSIYKPILHDFIALYAARYGGEFVPILGFIFAVLFAIGIGYFIERVNKNLFVALIIIMAISMTIPGIYINDIQPYTHYSYYVNIPRHVYNLSNYVNSNIGNYSVATLPAASGFQFLASWYTGTDIYSYLINAPVFTGGYVKQTEIFYPITKFYYDNIGTGIDTSKIKNTNYISSMLGVLGIRYIVVQGSAVQTSKADLNYGDPFSFNTIYANLNNSDNITFVKKFGNSSLYINTKAVPLIYTSNIKNAGNISIDGIFSIIGSNAFDLKNNSVFSTEVNGLYNDSTTINATPLLNFHTVNITFVKDSPTRVTIEIQNARDPFYLVFRETYSKYWHAYYSNGTEVNPKDHIAVNGFANAWYMNKTGNYTITLYYTLQTDAWIAWAMSFMALGATAAIGVYGWKERTKNNIFKRG